MQVAALLALQDEHRTEEDNPALGSCFKSVVSVLKRARQLDLQAEALDEEFRQKEEDLADTIMSSVEGSADLQAYITETTALRKQQQHLVSFHNIKCKTVWGFAGRNLSLKYYLQYSLKKNFISRCHTNLFLGRLRLSLHLHHTLPKK